MYDERVAKKHLDRMFEPEALRKLRDQIAELDARDIRAQQEAVAEQLRQEIRRRGEKPCA